MKVEGKIAVVTGASSGIGKATAELLSKNGAKVALVARSKEKLEELSKKLPGSFVIVCDMSKADEVRKMIQEVFSHFGKIDILVNNAGRGYDSALINIDIQKYHELFDLNLVGPLVAMQEVIPVMKKQEEGFIMNVSSGTALMNIPNISAYASLKRALVGLSLAANIELKQDNIHVSIIYPYITDTNFYQNRMSTDNSKNVRVGDDKLPQADSAEFIAEKILEGIETEELEIYAHDWMKKSS